MTYVELLSNILKLTNRPQIAQSVPMFVTLVEADLNRRLAAAGITSGQGRASSTVSAGVEYWDAPDDIARVIDLIRKTDGMRVESVTPSSFDDLRARDALATGKPRWFTLAGGAFRLFPIPDANCELELSYQRRLDGLCDANQSNWVSTMAPDAYIYGVLWKAAEFTHETDKMSQYLPLYERAVGGLIEAERDKGGSQRSPAFRPRMPFSGHFQAGCAPTER